MLPLTDLLNIQSQIFKTNLTIEINESSLYFSFPPESIKVIFKQKTIPKFDIKSKEKTILKGTELGSELDKIPD
ncbi:hypothetical protein Anas_08768 [Armadillidium nasatum]|uniref:Uncharacterized protein n=1 Tax=Armadillidium nasatum TaxID=96803 RepID=A0A5N5TBS9_9CRUS|nr:hypothetical protein Anas_08768 [Armadillidium nasatum]